MTQHGISPKVKNPVIVSVIAGIALVVLGLLQDDNELVTAGVGILCAALGGGVIGYESPNNDIEPPVFEDTGVVEVPDGT